MRVDGVALKVLRGWGDSVAAGGAFDATKEGVAPYLTEVPRS